MFILISLFSDKLLHLAFKWKRKELWIIICCFSFLFMLSTVDIVVNNNKIIELTTKRNNVFADRETNLDILLKKWSALINKHTKEGEKDLILHNFGYQSVMHLESKTYSVFSPAIIDMFYTSDLRNLYDTIENNKNVDKLFYFMDFSRLDKRILQLVNNHFNPVEFQEGLFYFVRDKNFKFSDGSLLADNNKELFYKNFYKKGAFSDIGGNYMGDYGKVTLGDTFSIEFIFKPELQCKDEISLVNNMQLSPKGGLTIILNKQKNKMLFGLPEREGKMTVFEIPYYKSKWNYIAVTLRNNAVTVFSNKEEPRTFILPDKYHESQSPLFIGIDYIGKIREFRISKGILDKSTINKKIEHFDFDLDINKEYFNKLQ